MHHGLVVPPMTPCFMRRRCVGKTAKPWNAWRSMYSLHGGVHEIDRCPTSGRYQTANNRPPQRL
eukprot:10549674-Alexandrium_andersonii.AAC.1